MAAAFIGNVPPVRGDDGATPGHPLVLRRSERTDSNALLSTGSVLQGRGIKSCILLVSLISRSIQTAGVCPTRDKKRSELNYHRAVLNLFDLRLLRSKEHSGCLPLFVIHVPHVPHPPVDGFRVLQTVFSQGDPCLVC